MLGRGTGGEMGRREKKENKEEKIKKMLLARGHDKVRRLGNRLIGSSDEP